MRQVSKTEFKAHALEILRDIERTGEPQVITDRGRPTLEIKRLRQQPIPPLERLKGSVSQYDDPTMPISADDWENA